MVDLPQGDQEQEHDTEVVESSDERNEQSGYRALAMKRVASCQVPRRLAKFASAKYDSDESDEADDEDWEEPERDESAGSEEEEAEEVEKTPLKEDEQAALHVEVDSLAIPYYIDKEWKDHSVLRLDVTGGLEGDELDDVEKALDSAIPGPLRDPILDRIDELHTANNAYRANTSENWEVLVEQEGFGVAALAGGALGKEEQPDVTAAVRSALDGKCYKMVRQLPGGGKDVIAEVLVNVLNASDGGFCFLAGATLKVNFLSILEHLTPFWEAGRRLLIVVPISEVGNGVLPHLRAWKETVEGVAKSGGGLRFLFVTEYERESAHVKELAVFFRGGNIVKVPLTANLSGPAYGVQVLKARTKMERCLALQSAENAEFSLINVDDTNEIASDYLTSLNSHYTELGSKKRLIFCVPALETIHDVPLEDQEKLAYHRARTQIVGKVAKRLKGTKAERLIADIKAQQQVSIGLAVSGETVGPASNRLGDSGSDEVLQGDKDTWDSSDEEGRADDERAEEQAALRAAQRANVRRARSEMTKEKMSTLAKALATARALKDLQAEQPHFADAFRAASGLADSSESETEEEEELEETPQPSTSTRRRPRSQQNKTDAARTQAPARATTSLDCDDVDSDGLAQDAPPPKRQTKRRPRLGDECDFCGRKRGETGALKSMVQVERFPDKTACAACRYRLTHGAGLQCITFDAAVAECQRRDRPRHPRTTAFRCYYCKAEGTIIGSMR